MQATLRDLVRCHDPVCLALEAPAAVSIDVTGRTQGMHSVGRSVHDHAVTRASKSQHRGRDAGARWQAGAAGDR